MNTPHYFWVVEMAKIDKIRGKIKPLQPLLSLFGPYKVIHCTGVPHFCSNRPSEASYGPFQAPSSLKTPFKDLIWSQGASVWPLETPVWSLETLTWHLEALVGQEGPLLYLDRPIFGPKMPKFDPERPLCNPEKLSEPQWGPRVILKGSNLTLLGPFWP